jgi:hypothetical protein
VKNVKAVVGKEQEEENLELKNIEMKTGNWKWQVRE